VLLVVTQRPITRRTSGASTTALPIAIWLGPISLATWRLTSGLPEKN
jgi:hypothetical protein